MRAFSIPTMRGGVTAALSGNLMNLPSGLSADGTAPDKEALFLGEFKTDGSRMELINSYRNELLAALRDEAFLVAPVVLATCLIRLAVNGGG